MNSLNKIPLYESMDDIEFKTMVMRFRRIMSHLGAVMGWGSGRQDFYKKTLIIDKDGYEIILIMDNYQGLQSIDVMSITFPSESGEMIFIISDNELDKNHWDIFVNIADTQYDKFHDDAELFAEVLEFIEDYVSDHIN